MSIYWYLAAALLVFGFGFMMQKGGQLVERLTGRETRPDKSDLLAYDVIYFGLAIGIALPSIYLLGDADPLAITAMALLGSLAGSLIAQAIYGRKHS